MTVPSYTEEDVELVAARLDHHVSAYTDPHALARVILGHLAAAGRLVPPGSETREEWAWRADGDDPEIRPMDNRNDAQWMVHLERSGQVVSRIVSPWSEAGVPGAEGQRLDRDTVAEVITLALCSAWPVEIGSDLVFAEQVGRVAAAALFEKAKRSYLFGITTAVDTYDEEQT